MTKASELLKVADVMRILRLNESQRHLLYRAEERRVIPVSQRLDNGKLQFRAWAKAEVPAIGSELGFIRRPDDFQSRILSFSIGKGGTAKSTIAYNFGRILAINGVRVLLLGLDEQESLTSFALPEPEIHDLEDVARSKRLGLYDAIYNQIATRDIIIETDLPTLHIIPENPDLTKLEDNLFNTKERRECVLDDFLREESDLLGSYDVIVLDTPPTLSMTVRNALYAADTVISPVSCEVGCFRAINVHTENIYRFQEKARVSWENWLMVATRLAKNKLSHQILRAYTSMFGDRLIPATVRNTVRSDEATALNISALEYMPKSALADDIVAVTQDIWERICGEGAIRRVEDAAA